MKSNLIKRALFAGILITTPLYAIADGWESFVPDLTVCAAFDASNEEMKKAVDRDNTLNSYMGQVLDMEKGYQSISSDLVEHTRYAYGNREDGTFSADSSIEDNPMSSLKQFQNFYKTITTTLEYYTKLIGYLCNGNSTNKVLKAQTIECLLTQGYETYVVLDEYWSLRKEELEGGRIIKRDILWYVDIADNLSLRLRRINKKLYTQVRLVRSQRMTETQDMQEWILKRAEKRVHDELKDITK